jgi:hypothetical protein
MINNSRRRSNIINPTKLPRIIRAISADDSVIIDKENLTPSASPIRSSNNKSQPSSPSKVQDSMDPKAARKKSLLEEWKLQASRPQTQQKTTAGSVPFGNNGFGSTRGAPPPSQKPPVMPMPPTTARDQGANRTTSRTQRSSRMGGSDNDNDREHQEIPLSKAGTIDEVRGSSHATNVHSPQSRILFFPPHWRSSHATNVHSPQSRIYFFYY